MNGWSKFQFLQNKMARQNKSFDRISLVLISISNCSFASALLCICNKQARTETRWLDAIKKCMFLQIERWNEQRANGTFPGPL